MTARLPRERPARVTIVDRSGRTVVGEVGTNRGDDAAPYTTDELRAKFLALCSRVWPTPHAEALLAATLALARPPAGGGHSPPRFVRSHSKRGGAWQTLSRPWDSVRSSPCRHSHAARSR